jgi:RimJ/RimL family protein N-acetyltransferase
VDAAPARPLDAEFYVNELKEQKQDKNMVLFRLRTLDDDKLIGFADLHVRWNMQTCFLAIGIGDPDYWNRGLGTDATRLVVNYAFRELNLYRVGLSVYAYNERAVHVYEKVGFVHEGRQRAALYRDGQRFDLLYMSVLRPEWEARL